jgi:hypothetical protein
MASTSPRPTLSVALEQWLSRQWSVWYVQTLTFDSRHTTNVRQVVADDDNNVAFSYQLSGYTAQNAYGTSWAAQSQRYYSPISIPLPSGCGSIFRAYYSTYGHNYATTTLSNTQEEDEEALRQASKSRGALVPAARIQCTDCPWHVVLGRTRPTLQSELWSHAHAIQQLSKRHWQR